MTRDNQLVLLRATDVADLLDYASCIAAVERAFRLQAASNLTSAAMCAVHVRSGGFHVKAAVIESPRSYFAAKTNANMPGNPAQYGLPTIQGLVLLFDAERGIPLAVMESAELTVRRTAAATAVAAKYLAQPDARVLTICGCGAQGRAQLEAVTHVLRLEQVYAYDRDSHKADQFAAEMSASLGLEVLPVSQLRPHVLASDVCITCTPSQEYVLGAADVSPGAFVAGVGADSENKRELAPDLLAHSKLVVDVLEQCATIGDLHHALDAGVIDRSAVHAELGEIVAATKPGRTSREEITVFDSTGTAIQDVAAAALVYERAVAAGRGVRYGFHDVNVTSSHLPAPHRASP